MSASDKSEPSPLALDPSEAYLVARELDALRALPLGSEAAARNIRLQEAVRRGEIPPELLDAFGAMLELVLSLSQLRTRAGPAAELRLAALFRRTPQGRAHQKLIDALNAALGQLVGRELEEASLSARRPGAYTLRLRARGLEIALGFEDREVGIQSIDVEE